MGDVVVFILVIAAAIEDDADPTVGDLANAGANSLAPAFVARCFWIGIEVESAAIIVVFAREIVKDSEAQRIAESLGPHGRMIAVVSVTIAEDPQASKGVALNAAEPDIGVVSGAIDEDTGSAKCRSLGNVLCLIGIVSGRIEKHRHSEDGPALNPRLAAAVGVVSGEIEDDEHGTMDGDRAFDIDIVSADIDDGTHLGHFIEVVGVAFAAPDNDLSGRGDDPSVDGPRRTGDQHRLGAGQLAQVIEKCGIGQRHQRRRGIVHPVPIRSLKHLAEPARRAPTGEGMPVAGV